MCRKEFRAQNMGVQLWGCWQVSPSPPISPFRKGLDCELVALLEALDSRLGEPSTRIVCVAMASLRILLNCGVLSHLVRWPQCRKYCRGGTVGPFAVAGSRNTLSPSSIRGTKEEVKHLSPVNVPVRVLVFLLIAIGGTVVASRLVAPRKGVACCSAEVCARNHHHE